LAFSRRVSVQQRWTQFGDLAGAVAILLSPLSKKARSDFREDLEHTCSRLPQ
jgi:hypothetical protein